MTETDNESQACSHSFLESLVINGFALFFNNSHLLTNCHQGTNSEAYLHFSRVLCEHSHQVFIQRSCISNSVERETKRWLFVHNISGHLVHQRLDRSLHKWVSGEASGLKGRADEKPGCDVQSRPSYVNSSMSPSNGV